MAETPEDEPIEDTISGIPLESIPPPPPGYHLLPPEGVEESDITYKDTIPWVAWLLAGAWLISMLACFAGVLLVLFSSEPVPAPSPTISPSISPSASPS